jgi:ABC-type sugar transport system ATPase subunit
LLDICHRILVMRKGKIIDEVIPKETTLDKLFALCFEQ